MDVDSEKIGMMLVQRGRTDSVKQQLHENDPLIEVLKAELTEERKKLELEWEKLRAERKEFEEERRRLGVSYKLFVGNLSKSTTETDIRQLFEPFGTIKEIVALKDKDGNSKRSCFVIYYSKSVAEKAIMQLNGKIKDKDESPLVVRYARDKDRGNSTTLSSLALTSSLSGLSSGLSSINNLQSLASLTPSSLTSAALSTSFPSIYRPTPTIPQASSGSVAHMSKYGRGPAGANLYVNNITKYATEHDVRAMFSECGNVISVKLFPEGYGFVSFDSIAAANKAIAALHGMTTPEGKRLEVSIKKDKNRLSMATPTAATNAGVTTSSSVRFSPY